MVDRFNSSNKWESNSTKSFLSAKPPDLSYSKPSDSVYDSVYDNENNSPYESFESSSNTSRVHDYGHKFKDVKSEYFSGSYSDNNPGSVVTTMLDDLYKQINDKHKLKPSSDIGTDPYQNSYNKENKGERRGMESEFESRHTHNQKSGKGRNSFDNAPINYNHGLKSNKDEHRSRPQRSREPSDHSRERSSRSHERSARDPSSHFYSSRDRDSSLNINNSAASTSRRKQSRSERDALNRSLEEPGECRSDNESSLQAANADKDSSKGIFCDLCRILCINKKTYRSHCYGTLHKKRELEREESYKYGTPMPDLPSLSPKNKALKSAQSKSNERKKSSSSKSFNDSDSNLKRLSDSSITDSRDLPTQNTNDQTKPLFTSSNCIVIQQQQQQQQQQPIHFQQLQQQQQFQPQQVQQFNPKQQPQIQPQQLQQQQQQQQNLLIYQNAVASQPVISMNQQNVNPASMLYSVAAAGNQAQTGNTVDYSLLNQQKVNNLSAPPAGQFPPLNQFPMIPNGPLNTINQVHQVQDAANLTSLLSTVSKMLPNQLNTVNPLLNVPYIPNQNATTGFRNIGPGILPTPNVPMLNTTQPASQDNNPYSGSVTNSPPEKVSEVPEKKHVNQTDYFDKYDFFTEDPKANDKPKPIEEPEPTDNSNNVILYCRVCQSDFGGVDCLEEHLKSNKHNAKFLITLKAKGDDSFLECYKPVTFQRPEFITADIDLIAELEQAISRLSAPPCSALKSKLRKLLSFYCQQCEHQAMTEQSFKTHLNTGYHKSQCIKLRLQIGELAYQQKYCQPLTEDSVVYKRMSYILEDVNSIVCKVCQFHCLNPVDLLTHVQTSNHIEICHKKILDIGLDKFVNGFGETPLINGIIKEAIKRKEKRDFEEKEKERIQKAILKEEKKAQRNSKRRRIDNRTSKEVCQDLRSVLNKDRAKRNNHRKTYQDWQREHPQKEKSPEISQNHHFSVSNVQNEDIAAGGNLSNMHTQRSHEQQLNLDSRMEPLLQNDQRNHPISQSHGFVESSYSSQGDRHFRTEPLAYDELQRSENRRRIIRETDLGEEIDEFRYHKRPSELLKIEHSRHMQEVEQNFHSSHQIPVEQQFDHVQSNNQPFGHHSLVPEQDLNSDRQSSRLSSNPRHEFTEHKSFDSNRRKSVHERVGKRVHPGRDNRSSERDRRVDSGSREGDLRVEILRNRGLNSSKQELEFQPSEFSRDVDFRICGDSDFRRNVQNPISYKNINNPVNNRKMERSHYTHHNESFNNNTDFNSHRDFNGSLKNVLHEIRSKIDTSRRYFIDLSPSEQLIVKRFEELSGTKEDRSLIIQVLKVLSTLGPEVLDNFSNIDPHHLKELFRTF